MSRIEPRTGVLLLVAYRALETRVVQALRDAGHSDLTMAQMRLLQRVGPAGTRLTELAEQAQVTKQTAGALVDQLERGGWVERVPDPTDGRARLVRLSDQVAPVVALANRAAAEVEAEWEEHLGSRRMAELRRALLRLREVTDPFA